MLLNEKLILFLLAVELESSVVVVVVVAAVAAPLVHNRFVSG